MNVPPNAPVARACDPLCVEPRRTLKMGVDDGSDAIGIDVRQIAAFPDTLQTIHTPETTIKQNIE